MKKLFLFTAIASLAVGLVTATDESTFRASLEPVAPSPENSWIPASAAFSLDGPSVSFAISLGYELSGAAAPGTARLSGTNAEFTFELATAWIVVHEPLPWPSEPWQYDHGGSTTFYGSIPLPDSLREDFVAGRTALLLLGGNVGDFRGTVLPASRPLIKGLDRQDSSLGIYFAAEPPYLYTVQSADSVGTTNWSDLKSLAAASRTFEAVVTDSVTNGAARFYRIRRELGDLRLEGVVGQVFEVGYCPHLEPGLDCSPRPLQSTVGVLSAAGGLIGQITTGADGRFQIHLSSGNYVLVLLDPQGEPYPAFFAEPVAVTVERKQLTTVTMTYDAQIR